MERITPLNKTKLDICTIAALPFIGRAMKETPKVYTITLQEINRALG
jgi:hypothetical protein